MVAGDSMIATIGESDLAFVDTGYRRFETDGIDVIMFNEAPLFKPLSADVASRKIRIHSDNDTHDPQLAAEYELTICSQGQVCLTRRINGIRTRLRPRL